MLVGNRVDEGDFFSAHFLVNMGSYTPKRSHLLRDMFCHKILQPITARFLGFFFSFSSVNQKYYSLPEFWSSVWRFFYGPLWSRRTPPPQFQPFLSVFNHRTSQIGTDYRKYKNFWSIFLCNFLPDYLLFPNFPFFFSFLKPKDFLRLSLKNFFLRFSKFSVANFPFLPFWLSIFNFYFHSHVKMKNTVELELISLRNVQWIFNATK